MWARSMCYAAAGVCLAAVANGAATAPVPPSNPRLGAMAFVKAMELDDMAAFKAATIGGDEDYTLFEPLLGMVGAAKDLEHAARERFGKAGRVIVRDSPAVGLEVQVQESDVRIKGDTAVLTHKGDEGADPLTLRKTSAGWKVDLTAIRNRKKMAAAAGSMRRIGQALSECAADIRAGRFQTPDEAEQAVLHRMQKVAAQPRRK